MLYDVYLIFVIMYFVFIILAALTRKGGFALFAALDVIIVMWASAFFLQAPPQYVVIGNTTMPLNGTVTNHTVMTGPDVVVPPYVFDPSTSLLFLPWFFIAIIMYGWCTKWGFDMRRGWF